MPTNDYHEQVHIKNNIKLRDLQASLPPFTYEFFRGIEQTTSSRTRIAYAYDLNIFFKFLSKYHKNFKQVDIDDLDVRCLDNITPDHLEMYLEYLNYYSDDNGNDGHTNKERAKARKMACLRTFYKYFYRKQKIKTNPAVLVDMPKIHDKVITRLEVDEVARLLDEVDSGADLTERQKKFHQRNRTRDLALITLLLGTGIRVGECVGLNISDIDFDINGMKITRKGGKEVIIYFGEEVRETLSHYIEEREKKTVQPGHEDALFLSLRNRRLTISSVQKLVKKYAKLVTPLKNISPHKLRSTYGTNLYRETGDIYLVADVLGHEDVNTTRKHYAEMEDQRRRMAAKAVRLRD